MEGIEKHRRQRTLRVRHSGQELWFRIGEVSRLTSTKPFVLRYWETEFPMAPARSRARRSPAVSPEDIDTVFTIKRLLYDEVLPSQAARRHLRDQALGGNGTNGTRSRGARSAQRRIRAAGDVVADCHAQPARPLLDLATRSAPY